MKFTVDIEDDAMAQLMALTGTNKKGPAVVKAATEYLKREMAKKFGKMVMEGEFEDYPMTNDELESADR